MMSKRNKCLLWVRVSTTEQQHSLDAQIAACKEHAKSLGFSEIDLYTPVSESAKEAGAAFKKMLKKVKDPRNGYDGIVIEYLDRLSRNVPVGTEQIRNLHHKGIYVYSVIEELNTENMNDIFRADGFFIHAEKENHIRTLKTKRGTLHWLREGYHMGKPPVGYKRRKGYEKTDVRSKEIVTTEDAQFIAEGFRLLNNGVGINRLQKKLKVSFNVTTKRWGEILRNPIYMGLISNKALNGEKVVGKHTPIVSKRVFEKAQQILAKNRKIKETEELDIFSLKGTLKCSCCEGNLTAYSKTKETNKKTYHYYKCYTPGCKVNISAKEVYTSFLKELSSLKFEQNTLDFFGEVATEIYDESFLYETTKSSKINEELTKLRNRIEACEDDYYDGVISKERMETKVARWEKRIDELEVELSSYSFINKDDFIAASIADAQNLELIWEELPYSSKNQLTNLMYEEITFDKASDTLATETVSGLYKSA